MAMLLGNAHTYVKTPSGLQNLASRSDSCLPTVLSLLQKLKGEKPCRKGETPTAAVQRKLGYEDTELGSGKPPLPRPDRSSAQSSPSTVVRSDVAAPSSDKASSPAPAPRAKPRTSAASPATVSVNWRSQFCLPKHLKVS